ncbi:hypothetical protein [Methylocystis sp.]|jgi:hypothetical protein|uniref:hypothetical protein n=1 Tax=Methylocystis sp. TaxID=1911079 RepID=UPI002FB411CF
MKRKEFTRLIDTIFAATGEEEMLCMGYFDKLPHYVDIEASGVDAAALLPDVKHHMHQCPECEEVYLALRNLVRKANSPDDMK